VVSRRPARGEDSPRRLGARLLIAVLVILVAVVLYALLAMPHRNVSDKGAGGTRTVPASMSGGSGDGKNDDPGSAPATSAAPTHAATTPATHAPTHTTAVTPPPDLGTDFAMRRDPAGFTVAVHTGWARSGENGRHQVRYTGSDLQMVVVPGRDRATGDSEDPLAYQLVEPELADFRASAWSSASNLQSLSVRGHRAAEGEYTWRDADDQTVYARNLAIQIGGRYHVILISGPDSQRAAIQRAFDKAVETYATSG
jgi:hypothetical protein